MVHRPLALVRSLPRSFGLHEVPPICMQFVQFLDHKMRCPPIRSVPVLAQAHTLSSDERPFGQCEAPVRFFIEHLQGHTRCRMPFDQFPEMRWAAAIIIVVPVVEGPNAVSRRLENISSKPVEAESYQDIQIISTDCGYRIRWKPIRDSKRGRRDFKCRYVVERSRVI